MKRMERMVCVVGLVMLGWAAVGRVAAMPSGVWIGPVGDCHAPRLELTGGEKAFFWQCGTVVAGTATEDGDMVRLEFPGIGKLELTRTGGEWTDQDGGRWVNRERVLATDPAWTPVRIKVEDQHHRKLTAFRYRYDIESANGDWDPLLVKGIDAKEGIIEIRAPGECRIQLEIDHPDCVRGYGTGAEVERKQGGPEYGAVVRTGRVATGTVVDDATGKPLAWARVAPLVFTPPGWSPDREREMTTGANGTFTLRGIDMGLAVEHPDYVKDELLIDDKDDLAGRVIRLKAGETIHGIVRDADGHALAGVRVNDSSGKAAVTTADGRFTLRGLRKWSDEWNLEFEKDGFADHDVRFKIITRDGLEVTLTALPVLCGRVVMPDGTPARNYRVVCGPGPNPPDFECSTSEVADPAGDFAVKPSAYADPCESYWIGIKAPGAAPWDGVVPLAKLRTGDLRIELLPGAVLIATLELPPSASDLCEVRLEAIDRLLGDISVVTTHPGNDLAKYVVSLKRGEPLRLPQLRAGTYQLRLRAKGASPLSRRVTIGSADLDLGQLRLAGVGWISGVASEPYSAGKPWRYADGGIRVAGYDGSFEEFMNFKTDGDGRFRVDGVPVGEVEISFDFNESADIIGTVSRRAEVMEGQATEVRFEGVAGAWRQPVKLRFGGKDEVPAYTGIRKVGNVTDRAAEFTLTVEPLGNGSLSWDGLVEWTAGEGSGPVIPDLSPGRWRIRVFDWLGSRGFQDEGLRGETGVEVTTTPREPVVIDLGSRMLTGQVTANRETRRMILVAAVGMTSKRVFHSRCDDDGDFVIRYLPEDTYLVHARDDDGGWCNLGTYQTSAPATDCGAHELRDGGHAEGTVPPPATVDGGDLRVFVVAPDGVKLPIDELGKDGRYRFGHLRPGAWTVVACAGEREIGRQVIEVQAGRTTAVPPLAAPDR